MRKTTLLMMALFFSVTAVMAQKSSIKGSIRDTLNKTNLSNAVISVLRAKDSVLVKYTRTNAEGNFEMNNLNPGEFILMVSYPQYADYVDKLTLEPGSVKTLGSLPLITKANLLQEVIVRQRVGAIRVKGDTTEYRADSFHVSANADVQELLRKMPGIQVNAKGEITAQGDKVEKILVDGEEFFSDDPAVVTKNLRADAVDKVQTFDKKSDQAAFTGIDDGQKIKTLNIQLKEDKKKGFFGKVEAGTDFNKYYYGKGLLNAFKGKRKISGYVTTDNTKFESLNWDENRNYAGDANVTTQINDDGGIMMFSQGDEFSWGQGFPKSYTGGLHFSNKWNKDKHNSNNTFQFNDLTVNGLTTTNTQNLIPGNEYTSFTSQDQASQRRRYKLTSIYEWQIDSSSSLKITAKPQSVKSLSKSKYLSEMRDANGNLVSTSDRTTNSNDLNNTLTGNIFWRKKFKKAGRTISFNSDLSFGDRKEDVMLYSDNRYYKAGVATPTELIDQMKANKQRTSSINSLITYTEPLWKNTFLVLNYRLALSENNAERITYGKNAAGKYETVVDSLTNHFIFNTTGHQGGFNIRYNVKKVNFSVGAGVGNATYHLTDVNKNTAREVSFGSFVPTVNFNYTPKQQRRVTFSYVGSTKNPTLTQIQPLVDNINPQNIVVGNPNLRQSFTHNFNFRASDYKVLKSRSWSINGNLSFTENAISNASDVDTTTLKTRSQAVNVNGNYNYNVSVNYGFDLIPSLNVGVNAGPSASQYVNIVNKEENKTKNTGWNIGVFSGYWADKWINFWLNFNANYSNSVSSIRPDVKTAFWSYYGYSELQLKFKKIKTYVNINVQANIYQKTAQFAQQQDAYIVSPTIRKSITKDEKLEAVVMVNDIFNQNRGINRNVTSNFISQTINQTIQRYVLFSLVYNFSKNGKPSNSGF